MTLVVGFKTHQQRLHPSSLGNTEYRTSSVKVEDGSNDSVSGFVEEQSELQSVGSPHRAGVHTQTQHPGFKEEQEPSQPSTQTPKPVTENWIGTNWGERPPKQKHHPRPFAQPEKSLLEATRARVQRGGRGRPSLKDKGWTDEDIAEHRRQRNRSKDRRRREKQKRKLEGEAGRREYEEKRIQDHAAKAEGEEMDGYGAFLTSLQEWDEDKAKTT